MSATLGSIEAVVAVVALAVVAPLAIWRELVRRRALRRWTTGDALKTTGLGWRPVLLLIAALAVVGASTVAAWRGRSAPMDAAHGPAAIVFAIDVSRSMEVADVAPSRLAAARSLASEIVGGTAPGAVGLVVFAGEAELICPITSDLEAFRMALDEVPAAMGTLAVGSGLADGIARATATFGAGRARRLIVLLSDGEDTGSAGALEASAARAAAARAAVIAVGMGTAGGGRMPMRRPDASATTAGSPGETRIARLDAGRLQRLARITGGAYHDGADPQTGARLIERLRTPPARAGDRGSGVIAMSLLAAAFICLSIEWLAGLAGGRHK